MSSFDQYTYVDGWWQVASQTKNKPKTWQRVQLSDVKEKIIDPSGNHNCFMSVQRYRDATRDRDISSAKGEDQVIGEAYQSHYCGLYFDFDSKPAEGEELPDAIERARFDATTLVDYYLRKFEDINPAHIQAYFSGSKGFHILIRPEVFNIQPHSYLTYMIKNMAWALAEALELSTMDRSVYTISRMWRIENSVHQKTNLRR